MAQLHIDATVTDGSANVLLSGDVRAQIKAGDYFKVVGIAGVYEIGAISLLGTDTQIQLTAPFLGESGNYPALIHRDFSPEQGYPLIYAGDLDIPDLLRRWALQADSAPAAAVAAHVSAADPHPQYTTAAEAEAAAGEAVAAHVAQPDPHPQYTTAAEAAAAAPVQSVVGRTGAVTAQQVADAVDALLPLAQLHVGKPTADPATPITGSLLSGAMLAAGAIVEMGENSNGSYWRWESGLQVCLYWDSEPFIAEPASGVPIGFSSTKSVSYPAVFFGSRPVVVSAVRYISGAGTIWSSVPQINFASCQLRLYSGGTSEAYVGYVAIGWWK